MNFIKKNLPGLLLCFAIALPAWLMGRAFPLIGGPIIAIITGMAISSFITNTNKKKFDPGIKFTSKNILQYSVILLGFGLNLSVIAETGKQSMPIILVTITTSLAIAFALHKILRIPAKISTLVGIGSSICGGSAIAATAPVINANDEEVAQAISVIFFFNVVAALLFPTLGAWLGFSTTTGEAFGLFAGTAINDTSSVTAAAASWDSMHALGSATLDKAVTVKLTRTLAIIPITVILALLHAKEQKAASENTINWKTTFPFFILYFILASVITTFASSLGVPASAFMPIKELSKFFIILAMAAIGLKSNPINLIRTGGKPLIMGFLCWLGIIGASLALI